MVFLVKDLNEKSFTGFLGVSFRNCSYLPFRLKTFLILLGDNFDIVFQFDTSFSHCLVFKVQMLIKLEHILISHGGPGKTRTCDLTLIRRAL